MTYRLDSMAGSQGGMNVDDVLARLDLDLIRHKSRAAAEALRKRRPADTTWSLIVEETAAPDVSPAALYSLSNMPF